MGWTYLGSDPAGYEAMQNANDNFIDAYVNQVIGLYRTGQYNIDNVREALTGVDLDGLDVETYIDSLTTES
jgi:hypothetical protein